MAQLTRSATPSPVSENGMEEQGSGSTLSNPQPLGRGVEGLTPVTAEASASSSLPETGETIDEYEEGIPDPFELLNRASFQFNDKLYFWVLKPVATAYKAAVPQGLRIWFRNFLYNLETPIRFANCLLQGKLKEAGNETARFVLNTTLGFFGCVDQAKDKFGIETQDEDLGQTLGVWGMKPVFYLEVPFLGPFSFRDGIGFVGDLFLDPRTYIFADYPVMYVVRPVEIVNETSLSLGEYEDLKSSAIDPYVAVRDAYYQYRENKIKQ
jgi:phospholipid-binding lipoprotein MlaA